MYEGRREGGQGGHAALRNCYSDKLFSLSSMEFVTFNQIFGIFLVSGGFAQTQPGALYPAGDGTHYFVPYETTSWLRPWNVLGGKKLFAEWHARQNNDRKKYLARSQQTTLCTLILLLIIHLLEIQKTAAERNSHLKYLSN